MSSGKVYSPEAMAILRSKMSHLEPIRRCPGSYVEMMDFTASPPFKVGDRVRFGDDPTVCVMGADGAFRPEQK